MKHCPSCGTEYEDFARDCLDCRVALAAGPPAKLAGSPNLELVAIRTFMGFKAAFEAEAAKVVLEAEGIPCTATGVNHARITGHALEVSLVVREVDAARAVEILESCSDNSSPEGENL